MDFLRFLGFALVAFLVFAGLDYYQQDKKTDTTLSVSGYVETIKTRFGTYQEEQQAKATERDRQALWNAGSKPYFPVAPEAWTRSSLTDTDDAAVQAVLSRFAPVPLISSISNPNELYTLASGGQSDLIRKLDETSYVYAKDAEIIWFDITFKSKKARNTLVGLALGRQDAFMNALEVKEGFAVIDGVPFIEVQETINGNKPDTEIRKFKGRIGFDEEIVLRLNTNATDQTIRELLAEVDLAALNALLQFPTPVVGQSISVALDQQPEMARKMNRLHSKMEQAQERVTQQKLENLDMGALMLNTLTAADFSAEGLADITDGKVFENQQNLQMAYGTALSLLLQPDQRQAKANIPALGGGLLAGLKSMFSRADRSEEQSAEVTVRKGLGEGGSCSVFGSSKRCSIGGD